MAPRRHDDVSRVLRTWHRAHPSLSRLAWRLRDGDAVGLSTPVQLLVHGVVPGRHEPSAGGAPPRRVDFQRRPTAIGRHRRYHHLLTATQASSFLNDGWARCHVLSVGTRRHADLAPHRTKLPKNGLRKVSHLVFIVQGGNKSGFRL